MHHNDNETPDPTTSTLHGEMPLTQTHVPVQPSIYDGLKQAMKYTPDLEQMIVETVDELLDRETSAFRPGMLLGKVQSGKTRAFIGIIGRAFDTGFDVSVVLTKGTKPLAQQTVSRLRREFHDAREAERLEIYDVMPMPSAFNRWEAERKLIFVCKKQKDNLRNLRDLLLSDEYRQAGRRVLFIDDEADYASVGFSRTDGDVKVATIAATIDELRCELKKAGAAPAFLQVTATPYALYLQPESIEIAGKTYERTRPSFTKLVPVHDRYIGSDFYFDESHPLNPIAEHCFHPIKEEEELSALKKYDGRKVKASTVLTAKAVSTVRTAVVQFIVGAAIRRLQAAASGHKPLRYSFIVHTETGKPSHTWQAKLFGWVVDALRSNLQSDEVRDAIKLAIETLEPSVLLAGGVMPSSSDLHKAFAELVDAVKIEVVNSEKDVENLLDEEGQLRLSSPLNLFVGGQILDRGITIANLIGFFYGRSPRKFQQDTVLQHARIFGARPKDDLAVTRFYTTLRLHKALERIHEIDTALREAFELGGHEQGVVFIQRDRHNEIVPCSPNKILLSNAVTLRPHRRMLPVGFQTCTPKHETLAKISALDADIDAACPPNEAAQREKLRDPKLVNVSTALDWLDRIADTLEFDAGMEYDWGALRAALEYLAAHAETPGTVHVIVRTGRTLERVRRSGATWRYSNAPDTTHREGHREGNIAREKASGHTPALMLIRQDGNSTQGWKDCPFWWPVLLTPKLMKPVIFSADTADDDTEED